MQRGNTCNMVNVNEVEFSLIMPRMWSKAGVDGWKYNTNLCGFAVRTELFGAKRLYRFDVFSLHSRSFYRAVPRI